jgi:uncharacterized protein YfdQ (DUF2303 family)
MESITKGSIGSANTNAAAAALLAEEYARKSLTLTGEIKDHHDGRPYRIKENGDIEIVEKLLDQPHWRRGVTTFYEALSFSRYIKRFRNASSVIFADGISAVPTFTAILDYHLEGTDQHATQWDLFRALLPLRKTSSWLTWEGANGQLMEQAPFAQFLEDNIPDIYEPVGAQLVEIARTLEANVDVSFQSHIRADNGSHRFGFVETVNGSATTSKDGKVDIPQDFILVLQPFEGSKQYKVNARLRYRLAGGKVKLGFELVRLQDVLKEAFNDEMLKIDDELNNGSGAGAALGDPLHTPIYNGPAPVALTPPSISNG